MTCDVANSSTLLVEVHVVSGYTVIMGVRIGYTRLSILIQLILGYKWPNQINDLNMILFLRLMDRLYKFRFQSSWNKVEYALLESPTFKEHLKSN